ncbi:MAG TPA: matrixin family metalloprotease [Candidatus Saccharimonadales bacterium]|nr:matrixin family metalloprotease [Candidatus Saccharimonadales bacterium]
MRNKNKVTQKRIVSSLLTAVYIAWTAQSAAGYAYNQVVPDVRQPVSLSGGSACPVRAHRRTAPSSIAVRWSTTLGTNPVSILTQNQTAAGRLTEIEQVITQSLAVWTGVTGTTLLPASITTPQRVATQNACGSDGLNSICFDQADTAFTPGILAFTRVITSDALGEQIAASPAATELGQILDADIYFDPSDAQVTFATPAVLPLSLQAYDLQSVLTHELGHFLGFSHSATWSAMMYPYAPAPGTFNGTRPTQQQPDAPLSDDDRTGLRVLYPDPADAVNIGTISGRVLPANPLSLPLSPPGVTGIFGAHVVAVDQASGAVIAATIAGWSCASPGPAQFDGTYELDHLPINHSYIIYAEPLDGVVSPAQITPAIATLCRNPATDPGWPPLRACVVPAVNTSFTTRSR